MCGGGLAAPDNCDISPRCPDHSVCASTVALVKQAMSPWSPATHMLYSPEFRGTIRAMMLVANRLQQARDSDVMFWLPSLMWKTVCSFFVREQRGTT